MNDSLVHVRTIASDILIPLRRNILYKVHIKEMHSFLQDFGIHSLQIDFRILM